MANGVNTPRLFAGMTGQEIKFNDDDKTRFFADMLLDVPRDGRLSAGITYLGQMIAHDLVPKTNPGSKFLPDVTPVINLESLYGTAQYQSKAIKNNGKFKIVRVKDPNTGKSHPDKSKLDLLRQPDGKAIIPDQRNDNNILNSQMHLLWQRFHNKVIDVYFSDMPKHQRFAAAQAFVIEVFQQVVVDDFLYHVLEPDIFDLYCVQNRRFIIQQSPLKALPVEFTHAVFRFGHSMIRKKYVLQRGADPTPLETILQQGKHLKPEQVVEWRQFFGKDEGGHWENNSSKIDLRLAPPLGNVLLNGESKHLASLNFTADQKVHVATGAQIVKRIRSKHPELAKLAKLRKRDGFEHPQYTLHEFLKYNESLDHNSLPLWIYVLIEQSSQNETGMRLGMVGSIIVAEVLMNAVSCSSKMRRCEVARNSGNILAQVNARLGCFYRSQSRLTMGDVVNFTDNLNEDAGEKSWQ